MGITLFLIIGSALLWLSAEGLIKHSTRAATKFRVPATTIGLTVIAMGTSLPELVTNVVARAHNSPGALTLGSVIGSNCANIAIVLGVCTLIRPIRIASYFKKRHIPLLLITTALFCLFLIQKEIGRFDGIALLGIGLITLFYQLSKNKTATLEQIKKEEPIHLDKKHPTFHLCMVGVSIIGLVLGAHFLVEGAVRLAEHSGLSTRVISLTILAVGTSLPEWASAIVATIRKQYEMAISLVIGSNIFNLFIITGISALIRPFSFPKSFLWVDWPILLILTALVWVFSFRKTYRWPAGVCMLIVYIGYLSMLFFSQSA